MNILKNIILAASLLVCLGSTQIAAAKNKKHITIVVGTHHYQPNKTMPKLKEELEKFGFEVTLLNPDYNPEKKPEGVPGLEVLKDTDLAVFFTRWLKLEKEQLGMIMDYVKAGKPVVGFRTTTHGFIYDKEDPNFKLNVGFGRDYFGTPYLIHLSGNTSIQITKGQEKHPILTGVSGEWSSPGTLYLSDLQEGVTPILDGTGNSKRTGTVTNMFGTHQLQATMTDHIAWTWTNKHGGKSFYTSLGHEGDFAEPKSMRVMINGIHWAAGEPIPSEDTKIGTYIIEAKKKAKVKKKKTKNPVASE